MDNREEYTESIENLVRIIAFGKRHDYCCVVTIVNNTLNFWPWTLCSLFPTFHRLRPQSLYFPPFVVEIENIFSS